MKSGIIRLSDKQKTALSLIGSEWAQSHSRITSGTLIALEARGLIERKCLDVWAVIYANLPYTSPFYQWRKATPQTEGRES